MVILVYEILGPRISSVGRMRLYNKHKCDHWYTQMVTLTT